VLRWALARLAAIWALVDMICSQKRKSGDGVRSGTGGVALATDFTMAYELGEMFFWRGILLILVGILF
jgi:hypothetical protein